MKEEKVAQRSYNCYTCVNIHYCTKIYASKCGRLYIIASFPLICFVWNESSYDIKQRK